MIFDLQAEVSKATQSRMEDHLKSCQLSKRLEEKGISVYTHRRRYDWVAIDEKTHYYSDDPCGRGQTELEAIEDLMSQLEE